MDEEQPKPAAVPNPPTPAAAAAAPTPPAAAATAAAAAAAAPPPPPTPTPPPTQNLPPSQPQPPPSTAFPPPLPPHHNKKRKLVDNVNTQNSKYFKIRTIVKDLRPHFIEVLRTPDFRNCNSAEEIRKQMSLLMDLYKEMMSEKVSIEKCTKTSTVQSLPGESKVEQNPLERHPEVKQGGQPQPDQIPHKKMEPPLGGNNSNKKLHDGGIQGSYVVGGSNFGWNFIMFAGSKPIYYGVTKESRQTTK